MRIQESLARKMTIAHGAAKFRGETWAQRAHDGIQVFWAIYDFSNDDIWTAIGRNGWDYNNAYDLMYRWGVPKPQMRISALIHETAWHSIEMLHEFEPETFNRFCARVAGVDALTHSFSYGEVIPRKLPFMFSNWREYRDYLLINLIEPSLWEHYRREWKNQNDNEWYKVHVKEIILNDTHGTINQNALHRFKKNRDSGVHGKYHKKDVEEFEKWQSQINQSQK